MKNLFDEQTREWIRSRQGNVPAMATRGSYALCFWIAMVLLILGNSGCDRQRSSAVGQNSTELLAIRSPEEIYGEIITLFRREVEGVTTDTSSSKGAVLTHKIERKVKDELIPPAAPADNYKARITVDTRLNSTFRSTADDKEDEDEKEQKANATGQGGIEEPFSYTDPPLPEDLDESLATKLRTSQGRLKELVKPVLSKRVNEYEDTYELEFKDGRWILAQNSQERFIQAIFDYVLNRQ
jgi:hypothetical protein